MRSASAAGELMSCENDRRCIEDTSFAQNGGVVVFLNLGGGAFDAGRRFPVESSAFAGMPPTGTCMGCHKIIWKDSPLLAPLWTLLHSDRFQAAVTELGGYSTKEMGRHIR